MICAELVIFFSHKKTIEKKAEKRDEYTLCYTISIDELAIFIRSGQNILKSFFVTKKKNVLSTPSY